MPDLSAARIGLAVLAMLALVPALPGLAAGQAADPPRDRPPLTAPEAVDLAPLIAPAPLPPPAPRLPSPAPVAVPAAPQPGAQVTGAAPIPADIPAAPRTEPAPRPEPMAPGGPVPAELAGLTDLTIPFAAGVDALDPAASDLLDRVAARLMARPGERLELRAYAPDDPADTRDGRRLSLARALAVRTHLLQRGVAKDRLIVFALGARVPGGPADRVDLGFR